MVSLQENPALRAGLFMVLSMAAFVINDTCVKLIGPRLPVGEIIALRGILSILFIGAIARRQGVTVNLAQIRTGSVVLRATADLIATVMFITAIMHMKIANLTAVLQAVPFAVALLSIPLLGETVGWRRGTAIAAGFIGVLMIVKPAPSTFSTYELLALLIVFLVALRDIITKRIPQRVPSLVVAMVNAAFVTAGGAVLCLFQGVVWPGPREMLLLVLAATFLSCGYTLIVVTLRLGELSATAPFRYSIMVFAIISGVVVFREFPDFLAMIGMALIVASGLYAAHRETQIKRSARTPAP